MPDGLDTRTTKRLVIDAFVDLPGTIMVDGNRTVVTFRGFNDRQLNRDLAAICASASPGCRMGRPWFES